jgi:hypothetical protein
MALLFIGGVMNLACVTLLAASVLAERVLPIGEWVALSIGGLAIAVGFAVLLAPDLMGLRTLANATTKPATLCPPKIFRRRGIDLAN